MQTTPTTQIEPYLACHNAAALWSRLHRDLQPFGFERLFFAASRKRSANHEHSPRDSIVRSSYGAEFDKFFLGGAFSVDVNTQWAICSEGAVSWDLTRRLRAQGQLSARQQELHERCNDLGLINGYTVSLRNRGRGLVSGFGLSADAVSRQREVDRIWVEHGKEILCLLAAFDLIARVSPDIPEGEDLTSRQCEVLEWAGDGKTIDDIAEIMGLSRSTVVRHMEDARARLKVCNTLQAVVRAMQQGQIYR